MHRINWKLLSQLGVIALMLDAAWVAVGQINRWNMWWFICLYWVLLTIKNWFDFMGGRKK